MKGLIKIFDGVLVVVLVLCAFLHAISIISFPDINRYVNPTFRGCVSLFFGVILGARGFFKTKPFYVSRKAKWPVRYPGLQFATIATLFTPQAIRDLRKPSVLGLALSMLSPVFLFLLARKSKKT